MALSITKEIQTIIALTLLIPILTGCATSMMVDVVFIGDPVELDFHLVHSDLPDAMVYWREKPGFNETALTYNPPIEGCDKVNFYVNPIKKKGKPLAQNAKDAVLVTLENELDEMVLWENIPESDKCAVLLTIGTFKDINFTGISASTRNGPFERVNLTFPEPEPADSGAWPGLVVAPVLDVAWMAAYISYFPTNRAICPAVSNPVKIMFRYPDNTMKESELSYDYARSIYDKSTLGSVFMSALTGNCGDNVHCTQTSCVSYWRNAAMIDLRMEFRREKNKLFIENEANHWKYRIENSSSMVLDKAKHIEFELEDTLDDKVHSLSSSDPTYYEGCEGAWDEIKKCMGYTDKEDVGGWKLNKDIGAYCPNAELGHADAQVYIGDLYYLGAYGIEKDVIQAYVWYSLAAENEGSYAADRVRELEEDMPQESLVEAKRRFDQWLPGTCRQDLLEASSISTE